MNQLSFFNTIDLKGAELAKARSANDKQDQKILAFFLENFTEKFTPYQVGDRFPEYLQSSVKRSITTLTKRGYLEKTDTKVMERQGSPNYCWRAANP